MAEDEIKLEATPLRGSSYAVRPAGCHSTQGILKDGSRWTVEYVKARDKDEAIRKARLRRFTQKVFLE